MAAKASVAWVVFAAVVLWAAAASAAQPLTRAQALAILDQMEQSYGQVIDYTAVMHKTCVLPGQECPSETCSLKFRKPFAVYMKWISPGQADQEMIYVEGRNDDKIIGHPGSFPDITVHLDPHGGIAMSCNRRPVTVMSLGRIIALARQALEQDLGATISDEGPADVAGQPCRVFEMRRTTCGLELDQCWLRARLGVGTGDLLPRRITFWDQNGQLIEDYVFSDMKINVGLTDDDFNPDNRNYDF